MAQFLSGNRQSNLNLGITSSTENQTVLEVIGKVGVGTADAGQYSLYVVGDTAITGVSSLSGVLISSGIVTSSKTSGIVTYYGDGSNLTNISVTTATFAQSAGISTTSTNVIGGIASVTSLSVSGISTLGTVQISSGIVTATSGVVTYYGDGSKLTGVTVATATYAELAGVSTSVIGGIASVTSLSVSGISTLGTVRISSGIVTATSGVVTYYGDGSKLSDVNSVTATFAQSAGISTTSTNVIGGIASVTSLSVSGISTLGTVQISSGIVTATSGVVTYYGDGSKLTGVTAFSVTTQDPLSVPVFVTLASAAGVSSVGISTTKLTFVPSSGSLGVNTSNPRTSFDVIGSIGIQSSSSANRFTIQHNSTLNSLDFIFV